MTDIRKAEASHDPENDKRYDISSMPPTEPIAIIPVRPETVATPITIERTGTPSHEVHRPRRVGLIAGIAGVAVVAAAAGGAAVFALRGPSGGQGDGARDLDNDNGTDTTSQTPTVEASPAPTPEITETVESLQIPSGLSAEKFGEEITDRLTTWINGGADGTLYKKWLDANGAVERERIMTAAADANSSRVAEALFGDDWRSNPSLVTFYDKFRDLNQGTLEKYVVTYNSEAMPDDVEPFRVDDVFESAKVLDEETDGRVVEVTATQTNNASSNRIGTPGAKIYNQEIVDQNGVPFVYQYSTHIVKTAQGSVEEILGRQNVSQ